MCMKVSCRLNNLVFSGSMSAASTADSLSSSLFCNAANEVKYHSDSKLYTVYKYANIVLLQYKKNWYSYTFWGEIRSDLLKLKRNPHLNRISQTISLFIINKNVQ